METKKKEAIRKAYGEYWETYKDIVDDNGWFANRFTGNDIPNKQLDFRTENNDKQHPFRFRIKGLQGIENNNGWQMVEDGFPPENSGLYFVYDGKDIGIARMSTILFRCLLANEVYSDVTHYQPIAKPNPPIY